MVESGQLLLQAVANGLRGIYSSIIPPKGGEESKDLRAREENQRKKEGRERKDKGKGINAKELRNFGIILVIHDRRLSGVYILL